MGLSSSMINTISSIMEASFILLFVIFAIGLLIAAIIGYKRGVYRASYKLFGLVLSIVLILVTMKPLVNFIMKFDISGFVKNNIQFKFDIGTLPVNVDVVPTTVEATLDGIIRTVLTQINASSYVADITSLIKTLVFSIVSIAAYIIDVLLIFLVFNPILELFWILIFKKAAPKISQKLGNLKVVSMVETIVSYIILLFLGLTPFTTLINAVNQGIQQSDARNSENETVQDVIKLVDIYNDSLFAKTLFNWNTNLNEEHLTFDTYILDLFTKNFNEGNDGISLSKELQELFHSVGNIAGALGENNAQGIPSITLSETLVNSIFDLFTQSDYITALIETSVGLALESDLLLGFIPNAEYYSKINLDDVSYSGEVDVFRNMALDIINSGIIDDFVDLNTYTLKLSFDDTPTLIEYVDDLFTTEENREKVDKIFNIFSRIDDFKLLNNAIQALGYWGITNDSSYTVLKFLGGDAEYTNPKTGELDPYSSNDNKALVNDFIKDIHLGSEIHMLIDSLWGIASCGEHVIRDAYYSFAQNPYEKPEDITPDPSGSAANYAFRQNANDPDDAEREEKIKNFNDFEEKKAKAKPNLLATLTSNSTLAKFRDSITGAGHMNEDGTPKPRDATKGEHYALLDSTLISKIIDKTPFMKKLFNQFESLSDTFGESFEDAKFNWSALMNDVYTTDPNAPKPIKFFKNEIESILTVITNVAELKAANSGSGKAPALSRNNAEGGLGEDPDPSGEEPFEYADYDSFLEGIVNSFDGWINPNDVPGSLLGIDSRVAPYISELVKCLKPLDNSKIIYALGIPLLTSKLAGAREGTQDFFDIDICIDQINSCDNVFEEISNFFSADLVGTLQQFTQAFLFDDEGKFNAGALADTIANDPSAFLNKLNERNVIVRDDPSTPENETEYDAHELKYYFAKLFKSFYNFKFFNPTSGPNANKNIRNIFDFVFIKLECANIERPTDEVYETLNAPGKWEDEIDAITEIFASVGECKLLNIKDYADSINSALLYSLAGDITNAELCAGYDPNMPTNLGQVLSNVGSSVLFSDVMGGLLDQTLDGTICDTSIGVQFANIHGGEYWQQEGENMNHLLSSIAQLDLDLENLDFTSITNVIGLNDMLHSLADSLIFNDHGTNKFGEWLYQKVGTAMDSMSGGLLEDPDASVWKSDWDAIVDSVDNSAYPTQRIAHYDFLARDGFLPNNYADNHAGWSSPEYESKMDAFKLAQNYSTLSKEEINELYKSTTFMDAYYNDVLQYDEIGRLVNVLSNGIKLMDGGSGIDFTALNSEDLNNILSALNNSNCLRISTYNAMSLAKDSIGSNDFVDINQAKFEFLIDANADLSDYTTARANRQEEIDHISSFYDYYKQLQDITGESLDSSAFFNKTKMLDILGVDANGNPDSSKTDILTGMISELESTQCFNLMTVNNRAGTEMSFFESLMASLMKESGLKELADIPSSDTTTMEERIRKISNCEVSGTENTLGYNSSWVERDGNGDVIGGECASITGVLKSVVGVTSGDTIDANELSVTAISASNVTRVMKSVNDSYLCTGVMKHFINSAFTGGLGLESLLKYDSSDAEMVANFDLSFTDYGGANNLCEEGTEIYAFQKVLSAMQYEETPGEFKFISLGDLKDALTHKPDCFDGIFYFLYNSKTLEKAYDANPSIMGRDILLYNSLASFDSYLIGNTKENKILGIEKIFDTTRNLGSDYYKVESNGISRIIDAAGNSITGVNVDNLRDDPTKKAMILNVVRYTYDRDDGNATFTNDTEITTKRAYFASEIVSGIFDDVLESEYITIESTYTNAELLNIDDYKKFYFASNATGGRATTAEDITEHTFDNLNDVEKNGLDGMISMTEFINGSADRTGASVSTIESNPFVSAMTLNSSTIRNLFTTKLHNNDKDSRMAKILFVSRGAKTIEKETTTANDSLVTESGLLVMLKYATNLLAHPGTNPSDYVWTVGFTNDYYDDSFDFSSYGTALMDYVDSCKAVI